MGSPTWKKRSEEEKLFGKIERHVDDLSRKVESWEGEFDKMDFFNKSDSIEIEGSVIIIAGAA